MEIEFEGMIWFWRGPAPWYFVTVPAEQGLALKAMSSSITYGWGVLPARARIGATTWTTSLFPKDGSYLVPLRASVRKAEKLELGEIVAIRLEVG